ncbi:hypothetical protein SERLA73DRAFT_63754 [Serpula lacrymans var. lacrymans S7.3]|uniref:Essential protein Yae1 N-terminal domain-containing protein n=2 Tax=Serpula lacrymans var. lacrymans TaxID=341189 RepID=F8QDU2_SERL3|nr:uncharacterized protein SERLADRAFT_374841 [Serpula lacrymans var. lacrymans S7.9]EGN93763.1 hypothetical protein SERLA73DRAFT_63754 [Serpula lacrymans var. lacrymans S7.3]EGO19134.1 hypothetical protein SERLADRAFT_374841 [Serpula lacrymans var. lacrymans S7.9]
MADDFDLESLVHLEQTFFDSGHADGFEHGRIHGLIEGRALGREKGFEIWEELGFYEGFANTWLKIYTNQGRSEERAVHHIKHLLELISQFPSVNPSSQPTPSTPEVDISKLQAQIRSRYKAVCASLGVRPSMRAADITDAADESELQTHQGKKRQVWKLEDDAKRPTMQGLSF